MERSTDQSCSAMYSGIVQEYRNHGGIVFLGLRCGSGPATTVLCRRDHTPESVLNVARRLSRRDAVVAECVADGTDWVVVRFHAVFKKLLPGRQPGAAVETLLAYHTLLQALRQYFNEQNFVEVRLPSLHVGRTGRNACFDLEFFGQSARLASSNALYLTLSSMHLGHVYSLQRMFRAEPSRTSKHLSEFDMLEVGVLGHGLDGAMHHIEAMIASLGRAAWPPSLQAEITQRLAVGKIPFPRVPYSDIARTYRLDGKGLGRHEKSVASNGPVFVTGFPCHLASWAAKRSKIPGEANAFNLLLPGVGEVAEGSERNTNVRALTVLVESLQLHQQLGWYPACMPYDDCDVVVFGLGVERLAMWLLGLTNIRQAVLFYRDMGFGECGRSDACAPSGGG